MSQEVSPGVNEKSIYDGRVIRSFKTALINGDRILVLLTFAAFGVYSWVDPSPAMAKLTTWPEHSIYAMFILTTIGMLIGYFNNNFEIFVVGHIFGIMGCFTVSAVVILTTDSPVSLLVFGLGLMLLVSLKRIFLDRRTLMALQSDTQPLGIPHMDDDDDDDDDKDEK